MPASPHFEQQHDEDAAALRDELLHGLHRRPTACVAPKFLYDRLGSLLFEAITALPEYYPTRTEAAILRTAGPEIAAAIGPGTTLIDLGAGNCAKAAALFETLRPARYVAVDISIDYLRDALQRLQREHPAIPMAGIGADFSQRLELPGWARQGRPLFFYPGSSIGNFEPDDALALLRRLRAAAPNAQWLIGVDLVKPASILEPAYDDALGVTAAFNLNLLRHLNRLLRADFDPSQWRHVARFDAPRSRVQMHLQAQVDLAVRWRGGGRTFAAGELMHTENSYKYTTGDFGALLERAGCGAARCWTDSDRSFAVFHCSG